MNRFLSRSFLSLFILWIGFLSFYIFNSLHLSYPSFNTQKVAYFEENGDDLKYLYCSILKKAKKSIYLSTFGLTDPDIKKILEEKQAKGVKITLHNSKKEKKLRKKVSGLYHKKILIIDTEELYIGSANCSKASLSFHGNQIFGFFNKAIITAILKNTSFKDNNLEFFLLPQDRSNAFDRLIELIKSAKKRIYITMYALTHQIIIEEIINAYKRGVAVHLYLDSGMAKGCCKKKTQPLIDANIPVYTRAKLGLNHHKSALIDSFYLFGSVNWSNAGFKRNEETFIILKDMDTSICKSIDKFLEKTKYFSIPLREN